MALSLSLVALVFLVCLYRLYRRYTRPLVSDIPGPEPESFIIGSLYQFVQGQAGETHLKWQEEYGDVVNFKGAFGQEILLISDPKALQYIYQTTGYNFSKQPERRKISLLISGPGIVWADGEDHVRQRKIMTPAFNVGEIRTYTPIFNYHAAKLSSKWKDLIYESPDERMVFDLSHWFSRATLDAMGVAIFDSHFNALDNNDNPLANAYANIMTDTFATMTKGEIMKQTLVGYLPKFALSYLHKQFPNVRMEKLKKAYTVGRKVAKEMIETKSQACLEGKGARDILSLLVRANASHDKGSRLSDEEMTAQVLTLLLAGYDTSASTLTWTMLELARHPEVQDKLRRDIRQKEREIRARGGTEFTANDLESLPYLAAVLKESLRYHPVSYNHFRQTVKDDVLPLSKPIKTRSGKIIYDLPLPKGTKIATSINGYQRNADVFGPDSGVFNPERWVDGSLRPEKRAAVGVYGNLLAFSAGVRSCIGWRFAVLEMQAFMVELVNNFEFILTPEAHLVRREACSLLMIPTIEGHGMKRQLPIAVKIAPRDA